MTEHVRITDVSPRDGLQNEQGVIPTTQKARLVELLRATGVDEIEVSSFVSPKWVPQLGDAAEVFALIRSAPGDASFSALVPNAQGMEAALEVNRGGDTPLIEKVSVFTAASETFSKRNTNATIAETLERFKPVIELAREEGLMVRGYVSCAIACPFEGPIAPATVADVACQLLDLGVDEVDLGDTIGAGTDPTVRAMLEEVIRTVGGLDENEWGEPNVTVHLHDTFGHAAECVLAALELGVRSFDGSVAGLGGCPYASTPGKRAPGNISTELLVRTVHGAGFETGVALDKLEAAAVYARSIVAKARELGGAAGATGSGA
ncbi:MAG TPA: hydroxymethylglutaryl-CoA lyase [Phycisphaerales bacterium]|nr:hydroxymethylglutaryl-CoA lyase [Phycisphaerales bacterium]